MIRYLGPRSRTARATSGLAAGAVIAAAALTACSSSNSTSTSNTSSTSGGSSSSSSQYNPTPQSLTAAEKAAILKTAFLTDSIAASSLNPVIVEGLRKPGAPIPSPDQPGLGLPVAGDLHGRKWLADDRHPGRVGREPVAGDHPGRDHPPGGGLPERRHGDLPERERQPADHAGRPEDPDRAPGNRHRHLRRLRRGHDGRLPQAKAAGIPIAAFGGTPGASADNAVVTQVQSDFCNDGVQMAETTAKMLGGHG